ncbi:glycosyltransferase [Microcella daejeonensis]|uniref:glycosyltransferase n=1 Tax=Microcella daejeonensis TaxID=2994971 RepID=UPI0022721238|nr:glycosyltransferase [Microcella daejeonensis]WAB84643.1 glycosyltransferase [Microcella daejeonensis]
MRRIGVVVPARDEEQLVERCLRSVMRAAEALAQSDAPAEVVVVLVADGCTDRTAAIARAIPGVEVMVVRAAGVGAARELGARRAIARGCSWLACTDADSEVPSAWLVEQLRLESLGWDGMIGTVRPDFADLTPTERDHWLATHHRGHPNGHVHGANLGVRTASFVRIGGFRALAEHEDVDLVERLRASGAWLIASDEVEVTTSGRRTGRTAGGYAGHLRRVAAMLGDMDPAVV